MDQEQSSSPPPHNDRPSSSDAEPEKNLSSDALILLRHTKTFQRVSADIQESWDAVQQRKEGTAPAQTFLAHSFGAWLAYVGVHRAAKQASNFSGKADCKRLAGELDRLPQDRLRQLAAEVVGAFPESQKQMVENFRQLLRSAHPRTPTSQPSKRQRLCLLTMMRDIPLTDDTQVMPEVASHPLLGHHIRVSPSPTKRRFLQYPTILS
ncbi:hypothetical protein AK830_g5485 [Neonectria ditissima]|uniref:Uncharacterized protein n=1 Tax=Neonectria ditissima TaxID=78410 RepID=A0A0P7BKQ5_9HYPO|nr:hypothetical protein AK830_g5485 [Neonectria ditissima]